MRSRSQERVEHRTCPAWVARSLVLAGGLNRFNEPMFRVVWGYDRIVPLTGEWQEFEQTEVPDLSLTAQPGATRTLTRLVRSVVETRQIPKYLPGNCWHLEMWRPPEEYGSPETWGKLGAEVVGCMTVDTAGPYPSRGEYELCYPLTHDGTSHGFAVPLVGAVVEELVYLIMAGRQRFSFSQRRAAIEQEERRCEDGFVRVTEDRLRDGLRPYAGETFIVKP